MIRLGSEVIDVVTKQRGMVTHLNIDMSGQENFIFQPRGLSPETGQPVKRHWVPENRLEGGERIPKPDLPLSVLGTEVEDCASGFKGTAIGITLHISGCVHIDVQPATIIDKTGAVAEPMDFDIRRLKGKALKKLTDKERDASQKAHPSPSGDGAYRRKMPD